MSKSNYKKKGKAIIRATEIIMSVILAVTGIASLLCWGTNGFTDWHFNNWRSAAPAAEPATAEPQAYAFNVSTRTFAATPRVTSAGLPDLWDDDNAVLLNGKDYTLTIAANLSDDMFSIGKPSFSIPRHISRPKVCISHFRDFPFSRHIPGPSVCISHFSRFLVISSFFKS